MDNTKHWHYKFVGFNKKVGENNIMFPVEIAVKGNYDEAEALNEVKQMIDRKHYYCKEAWSCDSCTIQREQIEVQKRMAISMENLDIPWWKKLLK